MLPVFGRWVLTPGRLNVLAATTTLVRTSVGKDREEVPPLASWAASGRGMNLAQPSAD